MNIELTKDGFLAKLEDWTPEVAEFLAAKQNITLTEEHWEIIYFLREFYAQYNAAPTMRTLIKALETRFGENKANSIYLHKLFPNGPALQANNIAGLPKPVRCI